MAALNANDFCSREQEKKTAAPEHENEDVKQDRKT